MLAQSIQPVQQFTDTTAKDATDAAMVTDAMDLLHTRRFDGFCSVSSLTEPAPVLAQLNAGAQQRSATTLSMIDKESPRDLTALVGPLEGSVEATSDPCCHSAAVDHDHRLRTP